MGQDRNPASKDNSLPLDSGGTRGTFRRNFVRVLGIQLLSLLLLWLVQLRYAR